MNECVDAREMALRIVLSADIDERPSEIRFPFTFYEKASRRSNFCFENSHSLCYDYLQILTDRTSHAPTASQMQNDFTAGAVDRERRDRARAHGRHRAARVAGSSTERRHDDDRQRRRRRRRRARHVGGGIDCGDVNALGDDDVDAAAFGARHRRRLDQRARRAAAEHDEGRRIAVDGTHRRRIASGTSRSHKQINFFYEFHMAKTKTCCFFLNVGFV